MALVVWVATSGNGPAPHHHTLAAHDGAHNAASQTGGSADSTGTGPAGSTGSAAPRVKAVVEHWQLPNPVSREGAVALGGGRVLVVGGLTASGSSSTDVAVLDTATGGVSTAGKLTVATHDAAVSAIGGRALVFGGGQTTATATVQSFPVPSGGSGAASSSVTGHLPQARADSASVTVGTTTYVVGGYDGAAGDAQVLATSSGSTFTQVATLPVAVRYPAVAALGGLVYLFGGEVVTGGTTLQVWTPNTRPPPGQEVPVVQVVDPATHKAWVAGRMPHSLAGAAAFVLRGHLFLAGGDANAPGTKPVTDSTVWSFDPRTTAFRVAGRLAEGVAYAGVAVSGSGVWLVGGEHDGAQVRTVERVTLRR